MTKRQVEQLLRHQAFLRSFARSLLRDTAQADDVVQEAWMVALRSAKRPDEVRRGWLAGIVRNLVRRRRREEERRSRRERLAARLDEVRSTDEIVSEASFRRRIAELVLGLPSHYREPLLLRYYEGLKPLAIADRLELSDSTVRTRLQRGLARIRRRLEIEYGGRRALGMALVPVAAGSAPLSLTAVATGVVTRSLVPKLGWAAVLATAVLVGVQWDDDQDRRRTAEEGMLSADAAAALQIREGESQEAADGARPRTPQDENRQALVLRGVVHAPRGIATRRIRLEIDADGTGPLTTVVEADRPFAFTLPQDLEPPPRIRIRALNPDTLPGEAAAERVQDPSTRRFSYEPVAIRLERRPLVDPEELGPTEDEVRKAILASEAETKTSRAHALGAEEEELVAVPGRLVGIVRIPEEATTQLVTLEICRADAPGTCLLRTVRAGRRFSLPIPSLLEAPFPRSISVRATHPETLAVRGDLPVWFDRVRNAALIQPIQWTLESARFVEGVVRWEDGTAAGGVTVALFESDATGSPKAQFEGVGTTDGEGRYRVGVSGDARYHVVAAAGGFAPESERIDLTGGADATVAPLVLREGASIEGAVTTEDGDPLPGSRLRARLPDTETSRKLVLSEGQAVLVWTSQGMEWETVEAESDDEGRYRLGGLQGRPYIVELLRAGDDENLSPIPSREVTAPGTSDFALSATFLVLQVQAAGGPVSATVTWGRAGEPAFPLPLTTDVTGRLALRVQAGAHYVATVTAEGFLPRTETLVAPAAGRTTTVPLTLEPEDGLADLELELQPANGPVPVLTTVLLFPMDWSQPPEHRDVSLEGGLFTVADLEPGSYEAWIHPGGSPRQDSVALLPVRIRVTLAPGETKRVPVQVPVGGRLQLTLRAPGELFAEATCWLEPWEGAGDPQWMPLVGPNLAVAPQLTSVASGWTEGGRWNSGYVKPGRYRLIVQPWGPGLEPQVATVEIAPGQTRKVDMHLAQWTGPNLLELDGFKIEFR